RRCIRDASVAPAMRAEANKCHGREPLRHRAAPRLLEARIGQPRANQLLPGNAPPTWFGGSIRLELVVARPYGELSRRTTRLQASPSSLAEIGLSWASTAKTVTPNRPAPAMTAASTIGLPPGPRESAAVAAAAPTICIKLASPAAAPTIPAL